MDDKMLAQERSYVVVSVLTFRLLTDTGGRSDLDYRDRRDRSFFHFDMTTHTFAGVISEGRKTTQDSRPRWTLGRGQVWFGPRDLSGQVHTSTKTTQFFRK